MSEFSFNLQVDTSGDRIDLFLTQKFPDISRSKIQKYIKDGSILVEGEKVKPSWILSEGEQLFGEIKETEIMGNDPENIPLDILYEDEYYIVINKKSGLVIHPGNGIKNGTLVNALLFHFNKLSNINPIRPGIVHRLDKDTTGVILVAKTDDSNRAFQQNLNYLLNSKELREENNLLLANGYYQTFWNYIFEVNRFFSTNRRMEKNN